MPMLIGGMSTWAQIIDGGHYRWTFEYPERVWKLSDHNWHDYETRPTIAIVWPHVGGWTWYVNLDRRVPLSEKAGACATAMEAMAAAETCINERIELEKVSGFDEW